MCFVFSGFQFHSPPKIIYVKFKNRLVKELREQMSTNGPVSVGHISTDTLKKYACPLYLSELAKNGNKSGESANC